MRALRCNAHQQRKKEQFMPRSIVERTFPDDGLIVPMVETGAHICQAVVSLNALELVTWILKPKQG